MERWAFVQFVLCAFIINNAICSMLFNDVHEIEHVRVNMNDHGVNRHRRSVGDSAMPHSVSLDIHTSNGIKTLRLRRNTMNGIPRVRITKNGRSQDVSRVVAWTLKSAAHYQDPRTGASIVLTRPQGTNSSDYGIFGSFFDKNIKYGIEPHYKGLNDGTLTHRVGRLKTQEAVLQEESIKKILKKDGKNKIAKQMKERLLKSKSRRKKRQTPGSEKAIVETGYYIGVTEYEYFSGILGDASNNLPQLVPPGRLAAETGDVTELECSFLTLYIGYINNEVDLRLSSFEDDSEARDFQCRTLFAYLHIFAEQPPIADTSYWENSVTSLGKLAGDSFTSSAAEGGYEADFDLHMAISRLQYQSTGNTALDGFVQPLDPDNVAFCRLEPESSVCMTDSNFCHATDLPSTNLVTALTKAVGLALSARIDNVGTIQCATNLNVMTPEFEFPPIEDRSEPWKFSSCSVQSIVNEVQAAFQGDVDLECLTITTSEPYLELNETVYGGQVLSGDAQCEMHTGAGSTVCRDSYIDGSTLFENICFEGLSCTSTDGQTCETTLLPLDDTQCGNRKMCLKGECLPSPLAAATVSDTCPFGDDPNGACADADCTDPAIRDVTCCETCFVDTTTTTTTTPTTTSTTHPTSTTTVPTSTTTTTVRTSTTTTTVPTSTTTTTVPTSTTTTPVQTSTTTTVPTSTTTTTVPTSTTTTTAPSSTTTTVPTSTTTTTVPTSTTTTVPTSTTTTPVQTSTTTMVPTSTTTTTVPTSTTTTTAPSSTTTTVPTSTTKSSALTTSVHTTVNASETQPTSTTSSLTSNTTTQSTTSKPTTSQTLSNSTTTQPPPTTSAASTTTGTPSGTNQTTAHTSSTTASTTSLAEPTANTSTVQSNQSSSTAAPLTTVSSAPTTSSASTTTGTPSGTNQTTAHSSSTTASTTSLTEPTANTSIVQSSQSSTAAVPSTTVSTATNTTANTTQDITTAEPRSASTTTVPTTTTVIIGSTTESSTTRISTQETTRGVAETQPTPDRLPIIPTAPTAPPPDPLLPSESSSSSDEARRQVTRLLVRAKLRRLFARNKHFRGLFSKSYPNYYLSKYRKYLHGH